MSDPVTLTPEPVPQPSGAGDVIGSLSSDERSHWRMTGELPGAESPERPTLDVTAESSPSQPVEQAAEVAASVTPASKPGTPSKKSNAETRKAELNAEILALKSERDRLRAERESYRAPATTVPDVTPASHPAVPDLAQTLSSPDVSRPMLSEQEFWEQFPAATVGDFARYISRYELRFDKQQSAEQQIRHERVSTFTNQVDAKIAEAPDFWQTIDPRVKALTPIDNLPAGAQATADNVIAQEIVTSPNAVALIEHLSAHPDVLTKLQRMSTFAQVIREIGRLESKLDSSSTTPQAAPAALPVSLAPPPPATLGSKPAQPADEMSEAIRSGDFARYRELQNRKELKHA